MNRVLYIIIIILCIVIVAILCVLMHKVNNTSLEVDKFKMQQESSDNYKQNNRTLEKVSLYVEEETISNTSITLIITDTNVIPYNWDGSYKLQKKSENTWVYIEPLHDLTSETLAYKLDENYQCKQQINWTYYYGELNKGKYRIVKLIYDNYNNSHIDVYSNEFDIK